MNLFQEVYDRVLFATNTKTQAELAELLEIRQSSISDAKKRGTIPSEWYIKLFERLGLNPDWIKKGIGPMYLRTEEGYIPRELPNDVHEPPAYYGEPISKSSLSTVYSMCCIYEASKNPDLQAIGKIALPQPYAGSDILVFRTESDIFLPIIRRDTYLGINIRLTHPSSGEIYAVFMPHEGLTLKRLFLDTKKNGFYLRTDQQTTSEEFLPADKYPNRILGRLAWVLQTY